VARVVEKPAHGDVSFENGDIFPNYGTSPLSACNSKRVPGLMISYRSEKDFIGQDNMKVFLIFPDGSARAFDEKVESEMGDSQEGANQIRDPHWNKGGQS
jgi:hypothetical protein